MAKKVYGHDAGDMQGGAPVGKPRVVRMPSKKSEQGYDYVDKGRGLKDAKNALADGIARVVFGPKKK